MTQTIAPAAQTTPVDTNELQVGDVVLVGDSDGPVTVIRIDADNDESDVITWSDGYVQRVFHVYPAHFDLVARSVSEENL